MSNQESIINQRLNRVKLTTCILGEPDIISIKQTKYSTNFFNKQKKIEDIQENFINGLIFPTTAHFSSFISTRYKARDPAKLAIKARLFMFDAYGEKDIQIQINIPGSLEIKTYNLRGEQLPFDKQDYERAYFSSFLRSLYPMNYPSIILYPLLNRLELLKSIVKNFVPFSFKNQLREMNYEIQIYRNQSIKDLNESKYNLSIQLLINYCLENHYSSLLKIILEEVKKFNLAKYHQTEIRYKLMLKKYDEIICKTAQKLLLHGHANRLKQHQIQALFPLKKYAQVAYIGKSLLQSGGTSQKISKLILISLIQIGEDIRFLKSLNLINNLYNNNEKKLKEISYHNNNKGIFQLQNYINKSKAISQYSQLCFPFDNQFYNRLIEYKNHQNLLKKNSKEGFTLNMLGDIEISLNNNSTFYDILVRYQKLKGWKVLMKYRADAFWLETDFQSYQQNIKYSNNKDFNDNYSFFGQSFQSRQHQFAQQEYIQPRQNQNHYQKQKKDQENHQENILNNSIQQSFDGNLSQHQQQKQYLYLPKCSAKLTNLKVNPDKKSQSKILCGLNLQKLFADLYTDIKLQNSLQNWQQKLKQVGMSDFSIPKRQLTAMIYLKKAFLHKKLQRNKKCEESFKSARKLSCSYALNLVAVYQLLLLYIDNKNTKGVEFYLIELMKLLKNLEIDTYDIVPQWAKPIIQYVLTNEGLSIIKNIHPIFKSVFSIFLRANYTQEQVQALINPKKQK